MACGKNELTLAPSEVKLFLESVRNQPSMVNEIVQVTKLPMFKVKSALRELKEANYIEEIDSKFYISKKGMNYFS